MYFLCFALGLHGFCLFCFSFHLECFMDHDSAVPPQRFLPPLFHQLISPFLPFIAFAFCIYLVILRPISLICMFYLPTHKLCRVKGHVTPFLIPYKQWLSNFIMHQNHLKSDFKKQITEPHHQSFWSVNLESASKCNFLINFVWHRFGWCRDHSLPMSCQSSCIFLGFTKV